ncbi:MAG: bifunctional oligoribonuclease/PAP phosphatase NrnA, partial [Candidatus Heimdallarchaeota archaeon]|nr:bifunctional oligoribonuclease/PAP phosphatase NrnA [Candidatus Heimdallarchaeota archaeon]
MKIAKVLNTIEINNVFLISTHVSPDPDALCSQISLGQYLKSLGKKVYMINEDRVPERFMFLPGVKAVKKVKEDQKLDYDVAIVVDCGDLNRIGTVRKIIDPNKMLINIDHHVTNDSFGDLNFVISKASSTAEVVYDLLRRAHVKLDKDLATLLYVGIMTDTGSFQYDNTSAYTHKIVGNLLEFDVPVNTLYQRLYETVPLTDLKYFTKIVNTFDSLFDGKVICVELKKRILNKFSAEFDLRDKIFKYLRAIKGVEVLVIF